MSTATGNQHPGSLTSEPVSWGRLPREAHSWSYPSFIQDARFPKEGLALPHGQGRSYGDSCSIAGGELLSSRFLNRIKSFDRNSGVLHAEAGLTLSDLLTVAVPAGWFPPVTPGTKHVSLAGALANDIHGKNHHRGGCFGRHVKSFKLLRSNGDHLRCSESENQDLYRGTIGGLGLTGFITEVELQLRAVAGPWIQADFVPFRNLDEFFVVSKESAPFEYTVAWLDCVSKGDSFGRGVFIRGNHSSASGSRRESLPKRELAGFPFPFPGWVLNHGTIRIFNELYFRLQSRKGTGTQTHYDPFFYPLDGVRAWNLMYGPKGLFQFQCVVPQEGNHEPIRKIFGEVVASGQASFLAVLKEMGSITSPGLLSFPTAGDTLCLDFANRGDSTVKLLKRLEAMVIDHGGKMYPAKDALMSAASFKTFYPQWAKLEALRDPKILSSFWKRTALAE